MNKLYSFFLFVLIMALFVPSCKQKNETIKKNNHYKSKKKHQVDKPSTDRKAGEFILACSHTAIPYSWVENGVVQGFCVDIMQEIIRKRLGLAFVAKAYPWNRAQLMVKEGYADAMITAYLPVRQKYSLSGKEVVCYYDFVAFTRKNHPKLAQMQKIKTLEETKAFKHGQYFGSGWAEKNLKNKGYSVDWVTGMDLCLQKLVIGRFDLLIDNSIIIRNNAKKLKLWQKITPLPAKFANLPFHVLISKKSQYTKLLPKIDEAIKAMKKDGTLKAIMNKY